jgi:hypothetical protein
MEKLSKQWGNYAALASQWNAELRRRLRFSGRAADAAERPRPTPKDPPGAGAGLSANERLAGLPSTLGTKPFRTPGEIFLKHTRSKLGRIKYGDARC